MRLLGIDPGEDVGLSFFDTIDGTDKSWQYNTEEIPHLTLKILLEAHDPDAIICEDFYHLPRYMKLSMITPELIGVVKLYAQEHNKELIMQNRGMKQGWPNSKLKKLGLFQPGEENEDAMDALRHRLVYQEQHGMIDWTKMR